MLQINTLKKLMKITKLNNNWLVIMSIPFVITVVAFSNCFALSGIG